MKRINILLISSILYVGLIACSNDETDSMVVDTSLFAGEWCMVDESGEIIEMTLSNSHTVEGSLYFNEEGVTTLYETISGIWVFYPANNVMVMQIYHSSTMIESTTSYIVEKLDDKTLRIRNQDLGNVEAYYRLINTMSMSLGEQLNISDVGIESANKFYSTNTDILTVDASGNVTALNSGTAYIMTELDHQAAFIKINVESRMDVYGREVCMYVEDIIGLHGTPDYEGEQNGRNTIVYMESLQDDGLIGTQYYYDTNSHVITQIFTGYKSEYELARDLALIKANYFDYSDGSYGLWQDYLSNDYSIIILESDRNFVYSNIAYVLANGHY